MSRKNKYRTFLAKTQGIQSSSLFQGDGSEPPLSEVLTLADLTDEDVAEIMKARVAGKHKHLD
jgi:hypothetical protein